VIDVAGIGATRGDTAWDGNWFFLAKEHRQRRALENVEVLTDGRLAGKIAPGRVFDNAESSLLLGESDPFCGGIR
jgi:proline racemase